MRWSSSSSSWLPMTRDDVDNDNDIDIDDNDNDNERGGQGVDMEWKVIMKMMVIKDDHECK